MSDYKEENSYRTIMKRISAFGGVQVFNVLIGLIRGKFVALFLGPEGMGINTLFVSSTGTIQQLAGLGLNAAMVKEVAACKESGSRLGHILAVTIRLILLTSLLGVLVCGLGAPLWSKWTFGNYDYTWSFVILAASVGFSIGGSGYLALLQGLGSVKRLAKASLVGSLTGLLCGCPLYWLFGNQGIVPAIVILTFAVFLFYYISFRQEKKPEMERVAFSWQEHRGLVKKLVGLGLILMSGGLAGTLVGYLVNLVVRYLGDIADVGLYQAANSITNQYTGVIFTALAMDYFPRLSAIAADKLKMREVVNRQTEIVMLAATPLVLLLILTSPLLIRILLTRDFLEVVPLIRWLGFGMLIQSIAFPIGYIYVACEDRKAFVGMEILVANTLMLAISAIAYWTWGLIGLGIGMVARNGIDLILNLIVIRKRHGFWYSSGAGKIVLFSLLLGLTGFSASMAGDYFEDEYLWGGVTVVILLVSVGYSYKELRKRLAAGKEPKG